MFLKRSLLPVLGCLLFAGVSCKGKPVVGPETTDAEIRVQNLGGWYARFVRQHGRSPKDHDELFKYIRTIPPVERVIPEDQIEGYDVSPRDRQPFAIRYGLPVERTNEGTLIAGGNNTVVLHEQNGLNGQKLVMYASGLTDLVDDTRFRELVHQ